MPYTPNAAAWDAVGLKFPHLTQQIVETPFDGFDMRTLLQYIGNNGTDRVVVPIESGCSTATVDRVAEGADCPWQTVPFVGEEIIAYKIGEGYPITHQMLQYQQAPFIQQMARHLSFKMRNTVNVDVMGAINNGVPAANVVATTGTTIGQDGTAYTIANTIGYNDLTTARRLLRQNFKGMENGQVVLLVNPIGIQGVERLPKFSDKNMYGKDGNINGLSGSVAGMQVIVSNNVPANLAFAIATDPRSWRTGQHTPVGFWFEARALDVLQRIVPQRDGTEVYSYWEYGVGITYGEGIVRLNYAAVSS